MTETIQLYPCIALQSKLTLRQCETNKEKGISGARFPPGSEQHLAAFRLIEVCPDCPGVRALATSAGIKPEIYDPTTTTPITNTRQRGSTTNPRSRSPKKKSIKPTQSLQELQQVYITAPEIAERTAMSIHTVHAMCRRLQFIRTPAGKKWQGIVGRNTILYLRAEVEKWIRDTEPPKTPPTQEGATPTEEAPITAGPDNDKLKELRDGIRKEFRKATERVGELERRIEDLTNELSEAHRACEALGDAIRLFDDRVLNKG